MWEPDDQTDYKFGMKVYLKQQKEKQNSVVVELLVKETIKEVQSISEEVVVGAK